MSKKSLLIIPMILTMALVGCKNNNNKDTNKAPIISGVKDFTCLVNSQIDFYDGVAALDKEDGDITPKLGISISPSVEVNKDGYATFNEPGEYEVNYKIEDKDGKIARKRAYVNVITRKQYRSFAMPEGVNAYCSGSASITSAGLIDGNFNIKAKPGMVAEELIFSKEYVVKPNVAYTFYYEFNSPTAEGKITAKANGEACGEYYVTKGHNVASFTHTVRTDSKDEQNVILDLCLGDLLGDIDLSIKKIYCTFDDDSDYVDLTKYYLFSNKVSRRFDSDGTSTPEGDAYSVDGTSATLQITQPSNSVWNGGMFIDTGVTMKYGYHYKISMDVTSDVPFDYEVKLQRGKWNETLIKTFYNNNDDNPYEYEFDCTESQSGKLWIYAAAAKQVCEVNISNLKVLEKPIDNTGRTDYVISDYTNDLPAGMPINAKTDCGNVKLSIQDFPTVDGDQKLVSPVFFLSGSSGNYCLTFKAKASKPIEVVVVTPVAEKWDPTIMWSRIYLTNEEQLFTFMFSTSGADEYYTVDWLFGSDNNSKIHDVEVEIYDVSINLKNRELDG